MQTSSWVIFLQNTDLGVAGDLACLSSSAVIFQPLANELEKPVAYHISTTARTALSKLSELSFFR
jgi:hypothetical protein